MSVAIIGRCSACACMRLRALPAGAVGASGPSAAGSGAELDK
jgi:hypothetical protein